MVGGGGDGARSCVYVQETIHDIHRILILILTLARLLVATSLDGSRAKSSR